MHSLFSRHCQSPILRRVAVALFALVTLAWSSPAFCGEIHDAAKKGDLAAVKTLLQGDPSLVSSTDETGATALHYAASYGHTDVVQFLLDNKADVNAKDKSSGTPLQYAAFNGRLEIAQMLISHKADVNAKNGEGQTALHIAAGRGFLDLVQLLLDRGAEVNAKEKQGVTPMNWALHFGHDDVTELLQKHGGLDTGTYTTVTEVQRGVYQLGFPNGGGMFLTLSAIQAAPTGEWEPYREGAGLTLNFDASFVDKSYAFKGEGREFIRCGLYRGKEISKEPPTSPRIVAAAQIDYDVDSPLKSPPLSSVGLAIIDANGFVHGRKLKSGWVNMPATVTIDEGGTRHYVRLQEVSFWVTADGHDWLSFQVGHATISDNQQSAGTDIPVATSVVRKAESSAQSASNGIAVMQIGRHRFHAVLPTLTSKLEFVEETTASTN